MTEGHGASENMLVKLTYLDELLTLAGDVIISSSNLGLAYKNLQGLFEDSKPIDRDTLDVLNDLAGASSSISSDLHHLVQAIRTVDLKDMSFRTKRLVRDIARKTGKRVRFDVEGEDTTVDKTIVEKLYDPISHQLRNAIDHGIEDGMTRKRLGKPDEGRVVLRAYNSENETFLEIEDDGKGVDMEALRRKGMEAGKILEGEPFTEDDALELMCSAGISTANEVSEVSGRGVGMDVVRDHITQLGGSITLKTEKGKGSVFTFRVPLVSAVNIVDALVVRSGKHMFAFPISSVVTTLSVLRKEIISTLEKGRMVKYLNRLIPLYGLNTLLDGAPQNSEGFSYVPVLVIDHKGQTIALEISEFFSPQKLVIIPFNGSLNVEGVSGSTVLGGRRLGFIIDVPSLVNRAQGKKSVRQHKKQEEQRKDEVSPTPPVSALAGKTAKGTTLVPSREPEEMSPEEASISAREFITEIEKLMPDLNEALFAMESNYEDTEQINKAFRLFHTIKGNFIMIGYSEGGETIHSVESVLDRVRGGKLEMSPEVMDILMDGVSYIEEVVRQSKAGSWQDKASDDILETSARMLPEARLVAQKIVDVATEEVKLSHEASYRAVRYRKQSVPFYQCYVEFDSGKQPPFLVACLIYKRVSELCDVLGTVPSIVDIENGLMDGKVKLFLASSSSPEKLEKTLVSLITKHYGATVVKLSRFE